MKLGRNVVMMRAGVKVMHQSKTVIVHYSSQELYVLGGAYRKSPFISLSGPKDVVIRVDGLTKIDEEITLLHLEENIEQFPQLNSICLDENARQEKSIIFMCNKFLHMLLVLRDALKLNLN